MNTESLDQSRAITDKDEKTTMRWESVRKRGIENSNAAAKSSKRVKQSTKEIPVKMTASMFKTFPERMMEILEKPNLTEAIYWLDDGKSFGLFPYPFIGKVLNVYFQGAKFESFTRKLNRWGFKRIFDEEYDPEAYIYQHPMFQKGRPDLLKNLSGAKTKSKESEEEKVKPQQFAGAHNAQVLPHQFHPNVPTMPSALMQRTMVNNNAMSEYNPLSSNPQMPYYVSMPQPVSNPIAVNPILLEQHQQYLEQQRFQQQRALLAQLRGTMNGPQQQAVSMQELQLLRAQNADRVRMLQQLQQQQQFQQQQRQRNTSARPPM